MPPVLASTRRGEGPPLVLVHGFTQTAASWRRVEPFLPPGRTLIAVDLPGHGGSADVSVADLAEAAALVGAAGGPATYVGYSLGGRTCLTLALQAPALVRALVLIGATAGIEDAAARAERRARDEVLAAEIAAGGDAGIPGFLARWLSGPLFAHLAAEQQDLPARSHAAGGLAASLRTCGTGTQQPSWERLGALAMPVLACAGADDARFCAHAAHLGAAIGENAETAVLAGAGHAACFEKPAAFGALLADFCARHGC